MVFLTILEVVIFLMHVVTAKQSLASQSVEDFVLAAITVIGIAIITACI
jgi:hypothetical protein